MRLGRRFQSLLRNLFRRSRVDRDLDAELRATVDLLVAEKLAAGVPEPEEDDASSGRVAVINEAMARF